MEFEIRELQEADIKAVVEIDKTFPPRSRRLITKEDALNLYKKNKSACLVAKKDGKIVGAIFGDLEGKTYTVKFLVIHPDYLGEGIGSLLIEKALKTTNSNRVTSI